MYIQNFKTIKFLFVKNKDALFYLILYFIIRINNLTSCVYKQSYIIFFFWTSLIRNLTKPQIRILLFFCFRYYFIKRYLLNKNYNQNSNQNCIVIQNLIICIYLICINSVLIYNRSFALYLDNLINCYDKIFLCSEKEKNYFKFKE